MCVCLYAMENRPVIKWIGRKGLRLLYGPLFLNFTTIPSVFRSQYNFSSGITGLVYLDIGIGLALGLAIVATTSDKVVLKLTAEEGGKFEPEMRLPMMIFFSCLLPVSFFWYG
ncbi:hypothetical protein EYZ11_012120 [Aspergillus tanneri]|uniref:Uncharacterized protein n=1 Tax=Aspergillus tanneri TaxID=1220188 RepID=A0A4S3J365_9EURO|nr:hypothetical protein EYZ11_012120 [Aspergillus tanneri]